MRLGKLDQRVILQSLSETNDEGELVKAYTTVDTVFAEVISQRGSEAFEAARTNARDNIRVRMHYRTDVTVKWRLVWESQNYNIVNVDRSNRRQGELWVTAQAVGAL